jgi:predicted  nucleic acid-binding Zn-ribbon protein
MGSETATAWRRGKPVFLLCAGLLIMLHVANSLSTAHADPGSLQTDERGFIGTAARCDTSKSTVAAGRTQQSLIAICVNPRGRYEYRGMRLEDNSEITIPAAVMEDGKYVAHNADVTYIFSAKELMILKGWGWLVRKEPMVAFVEPRPRAGG